MTCAHRYRYDEPTGPTSVGVCALCGATRTDSNVFVRDWGDVQYGVVRRQLYIAYAPQAAAREEGGMTEHNPGPWYMEAFGAIPSDGPTNYRIVDSEGVTVGFTYGYSRQDWRNGLLMTAAPELLAACEAAQRFLDWQTSFDGLRDQERPTAQAFVYGASVVAERLDAAITKARGEQL